MLVEVCLKIDFGFDVLLVNCELVGVEVELIELSECEYCLKNVLQVGCVIYDFIFIDCLLVFNMLIVNGLVVVDLVFILMQCEYYVLEGFFDLVEMLCKVCIYLNLCLEIEGLLCIMYNV